MRLIENKESIVDDEMYDINFKNHLVWCSNLNIYSNQDILLSASITSNFLIRNIYHEVNR